MRLQTLPSTYRHIQRYREIVSVLIKYGFGDVVHSLGVEHYLEVGLQSISKHWSPTHLGVSRAERVRLVLEELGPTFVKAGQFLSTRSDLVPPEYLHELERLLDQVPPIPFAEAKAVVEAELQAPIEKLFRRFDKEPLAAASIAQIHRAELPDGETVVVKVQRPGIAELAEVDLDILRNLASLAERHLEDWRWRRPTLVVEELARTLAREMDFNLEASYLERFAREFQDDPSVYVPWVSRELSSARVLTMEYIEGVKPKSPDALLEAGLDPEKIARRVTLHFLRQLFVHGFFHADPHAGNVLALDGNIVGYLDYGMMGHLDRKSREGLSRLLAAVVARDEGAVTDALLRIVIPLEEPDRPALEREIMELLDQHVFRPVGEWRLGVLFQRLFAISSKQKMRIPPELFLTIKALGNLEALTRTLDPHFDFVRLASSFVARQRAERLRPSRLIDDAWGTATEALRLLRSLPADLSGLLKQAKQGRLNVEFEHRGLDPLLSSMERVTNRVAFAILLAALIVGSALIVLADTPPHWHNISVIGLGGFILAALMAAWLLTSIIKHGRM